MVIVFTYDSASADKSDHNFNLDISQSYDFGSWNIQVTSHIAHALSQLITPLGY